MFVIGLRSIWQKSRTDRNTCSVLHYQNKMHRGGYQKWEREREREEIVIAGQGIERLQVKGGVHVLLNYKRKKWHGIIQTGNLETKTIQGAGGAERARCLQSAEDESESHLLLKCPVTRGWRGVLEQEMATYQRGNSSQGNTVSRVAELWNLGTFAYKIIC